MTLRPLKPLLHLLRVRSSHCEYADGVDYRRLIALTSFSMAISECCQLAEQLPKHSKVKKRLLIWLEHHIKIQKQITTQPLLVSSDIIESLFGRFKHIIERSPQADMNRTTLLIPALCGNLDETTITQALSQTRHVDLKCWEQENIPYTSQKIRQAFFAGKESQILGDMQL